MNFRNAFCRRPVFRNCYIALTLGLGLVVAPLISMPASADNHAGSTAEVDSVEGRYDIANLVAIDDAFSNLLQAVKAADLVETLASPGAYTVFAPSNAAFDELPDGALEFLLQPENQEILQQVLMYHVVPGVVMSSDLSTGGVSALSGGLAVRVTEDRVIVNNGSVINADIEASNGVIHGINRVLIPTQIRQQLLAALGES